VLPVRVEVDADYGAPPAGRAAAWERFLRGAGSRRWEVLWDRDTGAPLRVFGRGIAAPGSIADARVAEDLARAFLAEQSDLLAPGVAVGRFRLSSNDLDAGMRTVGFTQEALLADGTPVPVIGGRVSVRFKNDRLFVFGSEAFAPTGALPSPQVSPAEAETVAMCWIGEQHQGVTLRAGAKLVALPLVGSGRRELHAAYEVLIDTGAPAARYAVYVDARSGAPLARDQRLRFGATQVLFNAPVRGPDGARKDYPARFLNLQLDGGQVQTDGAGALSWEGAGAATLGVHGARIYVQSQDGIDASEAVAAVDGAPLSWSRASDERGDAQLSAYVHGNVVKEHALGIAPGMTFVKSLLSVRVNKADPQGCNAFWDGSTVNFFLANESCNNTARVADVVYHEFGHGFHQFAVIPGVGALDPSLGEGTGDIMTASVTHDAHLAPGFFLGSDAPLRDMDSGRIWPDDISWDPHETGLIWAGTLWDLRTFLVADLGAEVGHALTDQLFYQAIRRASSIPSTYAEVLAADDDDGDLSNGTPHVCAINRAFVAHGLGSVLDEAGLVFRHDPLTLLPAGGAAYPITVKAERLYPQCAVTPVDSVDVRYRIGGVVTQVQLAEDGEVYQGVIPSRPAGTSLQYTILVGAGGHGKSLPDNRADDAYSAFVGEVTPLYCNDFEAQIDGWTFGDGKGHPGDFQWGTPGGKSGDPVAAFSGNKVIGDRLSGDGAYKRSASVFAESPVIDRAGKEHVRLQLRRWLSVEDGVFDQATITLNGRQIWQNLGTDESDGSLRHEDHEWRFVDIDLSSALGKDETTIQLRFELTSDDQLQAGGWNLDDVCVVSWEPVIFHGTIDWPKPPAAEEPALVPGGGCSCSVAGDGDAPASVILPALAALLLRRRRGIRSRRCRSS
ncbi:MAG: MYXO-CTERM sorting domain-containing protein, partial [Minicystis sp.]